ncbi:MAG: hypothetical protein KC933_39625, partial [Myxococcales bacterium]|nr:hypothetical protein [Myxococcales bacterium]
DVGRRAGLRGVECSGGLVGSAQKVRAVWSKPRGALRAARARAEEAVPSTPVRPMPAPSSNLPAPTEKSGPNVVWAALIAVFTVALAVVLYLALADR